MLIAESRKVNMEEMFMYPLGVIPWALANSDGTMKKTNKALLSLHLEKNVPAHESFPLAASCVLDGMAIIQKVHGEGLTFEELSAMVLQKVLIYTRERIDVVFDVYVDASIKEIERRSRGESEGMTFQNIRSQHKIVNWRRLLRSSDCKNKLTKYLVESWREEKMNSYFSGSKVLFVMYGEQCFKFSRNGTEEVIELTSN